MRKKEKFIKLIQENSAIINKASTVYTSNIHDREDLKQEIIYQLWKSFDSFENKSAVSTWVYRIAMNVSIYFLNQTKKQAETIPINHESLEIESDTNNRQSDKLKFIQQQISKLNLLEKGIIMLYLEGKSHHAISEIIGISESNVGTRIMRIKKKLKSISSNK